MILGIINDIHEDIDRLNVALQLFDKLGCDEIACLGDIVGYTYPNFGHFETRDASACVQAVKTNCRFVVAGNHDLHAVRKIPEFKAGFDYPENWFELDYFQRNYLANNEVWLNEENEFSPLLSHKDIEFLRSVPEFLTIDCGNSRILLSHYMFPDLSGSSRKYYELFGPIEGHLNFIRENDCTIGFSGHKHVEGVFRASLSEEKKYDFGKQRLDDELQWIVGPCIVNGMKENGCMVFNTGTLELKVIPLNTPPRMMEVKFYNKYED